VIGNAIADMWLYDGRSNVPHITKKDRPLTPEHFAEFRKEDHVCFCAGAVWREGAIRQSKDGVQAAILGQNLEHITSLIREQAVVRHNDSSTPSGLQDRHHVLDEVELLVACRDREVVSGGCLIRTLRAKGRVGHHNVVTLTAWNFVDRITKSNVRFQTMQIEVH